MMNVTLCEWSDVWREVFTQDSEFELDPRRGRAFSWWDMRYKWTDVVQPCRKEHKTDGPVHYRLQPLEEIHAMPECCIAAIQPRLIGRTDRTANIAWFTHQRMLLSVKQAQTVRVRPHWDVVINVKLSWCWRTRATRLQVSQGHQTYSTIPYVRYSFPLCNSNFVFKTRRFSDIRLQKMSWVSWPWNRGQRSLKVIESGVIR